MHKSSHIYNIHCDTGSFEHKSQELSTAYLILIARSLSNSNDSDCIFWAIRLLTNSNMLLLIFD